MIDRDINTKTKNGLAPIAVLVVLVLSAVSYLVVSRGPVAIPTKDSRTLYEGSVSIETTTLTELRERLEGQGCRENVSGVSGEAIKNCHFQQVELGNSKKERGIEIFPHGYGFGPISFKVSEAALYAVKDIPGVPDKEKFKSEVREDVAAVGNVVTLKENSWGKIKTTYPWDVVY